MATFVINEWLLEDLAGRNLRVARQQSFDFLIRFTASSHQLVLVEGSEFDRKAWALCKSRDITSQRIGGIFVKDVRQNSDRCLVLKPEASAALPPELAEAPKLKPDDHYLVRAQLSVVDSLLVTTDTDLREIVSQYQLPCMSRDEFLRRFFGG